ncbi:MAG: hypothetical protein ABIE22_02740 [archaeon]
MSKKGQAAMEFLMTYGWAILAAIVVIAVLAWFGVFNLGNLAPSACVISPPFSCEEYGISAANGVRLVIRNGYGDTVSIAGINVTGCDKDTTQYMVSDGAKVDSTDGIITLTCAPVLVQDSIFKGDILINYTKSGGSLDQMSTGSIKGAVGA